MNHKLTKGFRAHLLESIVINSERRFFYSSTTGGKSAFLSFVLICWGKFLLPVATYFDRRSLVFNSMGIGIIADDFISMDKIRPVESVPEYNNVLKCKTLLDLFVITYKTRILVRKYLRNYDFIASHHSISECIDRISEIEKSNKVHISLVKHILESAAFAAKNAVIYSQNEDLKVKKLASCFIRVQMLGTILSPFIDRAASKLHRHGVGVLVNDIPDIPYKEVNWN